MIFAIDLEGVLAPEIWPALGDRFGIADLRLTTRDVADFDALMRRRVEAVRAAGITLRELQTLAHAVEPYLGAREFLTRLRALGQVIVISDTFHEFAVDAGGLLSGFKLRIRGQKERIVSGFHAAGFKVAAVGDSLNDLSILRACDFPVLFRPVEALRAHFPDAAEAQSLDDALALLERAWRRFESEGEPGGAGG
jgi:phosphoserine/homoserine phosphotransferase